MRNIRVALCLLAIFCTHAGCSQTGAVRPGSPSTMRTVASVGDKPLPSVSGEPGRRCVPMPTNSTCPRRPARGSRAGCTTAAASRFRTPRFASPSPVHLAARPFMRQPIDPEHSRSAGCGQVRLMQSLPSTRAKTESSPDERKQKRRRSTLNRLQSRGGESGQGHASIQPARPRVEPISNIDAVEDERSDEGRSDEKINAEDLDLPPDNTGSVAPGRNMRLSRAGNDNAPPPVRGGWSSRQVDADKAAPRARAQESATTPLRPPRSRRSGMPQAPPWRMMAPIRCPRPRYHRGFRREPADMLDDRPVKLRAARRERLHSRPADRLVARLQRSMIRPSASWRPPASRSHGRSRKTFCLARSLLHRRPHRSPWMRAQIPTARLTTHRAVLVARLPRGWTDR